MLLRCLVMQKDPRIPSFGQVIIHTAMGAVLGGLLALALLVTDSDLFRVIAHSPSPGFDIALLMSVFSFLIAAGATFSGFIFTNIEINSQLAKRRAISRPDKREESEK